MSSPVSAVMSTSECATPQVLVITATCSSIGPELCRPLRSIHGISVLCPYQKDERKQTGNRQTRNIFYNTPRNKLVSLVTNVPIFSSLSTYLPLLLCAHGKCLVERFEKPIELYKLSICFPHPAVPSTWR